MPSRTLSLPPAHQCSGRCGSVMGSYYPHPTPETYFDCHLLCCVSSPESPNPRFTFQHISDTCDLLKTQYPFSKLIICGDFHEINTNELQAHLQLNQIVNFPTHHHNTLDIILTDMSYFYQSPIPMSPFGQSTHTSVFWSPKLTYAHQTEKNTLNYY